MFFLQGSQYWITAGYMATQQKVAHAAGDLCLVE
jgi:hypothetical protein